MTSHRELAAGASQWGAAQYANPFRAGSPNLGGPQKAA